MGNTMEKPEGVQQVSMARSGWLRHGLAGLVTSLLLAVSLPSGAAPLSDREYDEAVRSFKAGRVSLAFGQFLDLANRGDVDAARVALFMHAYGPSLFGKQWDAAPEHVAHWDRLVRNSSVASSRPPLEFAPTVLTPTRSRVKTVGAKPRANGLSVASY